MKIAKTWDDIDWKTASEKLAFLQHEVLKAYKNGDSKEILLTQNRLVRSFAARCLAVRKTTSNSGKNTPGVDGKTYNTKIEKYEAVQAVKYLKDYKAEPVRRVYIPKSDGKKRPLGIPTMKDRVVQTLYLFALDPIAEEQADPRSYGFRMHRGVHDCATYLNLVLSSYTATRRHILDADIEGFFSAVSHQWLLDNIPLDKRILFEFLKAGFFENCQLNSTNEGFPQGSPISPALANMSLNGLQEWLGKEFIFIRYADDFLVLGKSEQTIKEIALPKIQDFLKIRGLTLNSQKTKITDISKGFDYLSFNFREYPDPSRVKGTKQGILLIKPSASNVIRFKRELSEIVKEHRKQPINKLIQVLNRKLRGWAEHFRTTSAQKTFSSISYHLWTICWLMLKKRHRKRNAKWIRDKYFTEIEGNKWIFCSKNQIGRDAMTTITLFQIAYVDIKRHSLCLNLNPYDPTNYEYFKKRIARKARHSILLGRVRSQLLKKQRGICPVCEQYLLNQEDLEVHHILPRKQGGTDKLKNLCLVHKICHKQITESKDEKLKAAWRDKKIII